MSKKHNKSSNNKSGNNKGGGGKNHNNGVKHSSTSKTKATANGSSSSSSSSSGRGGGGSSSSSSSSWNIFHLIFAMMSLFLGIIIAPSSKNNNQGGQQRRRGLFRDNTETTSTTFTCDDQTLSNYLHDVPIPGLHLVCIDGSNNNGGGKKRRLNIYKEAQVGNSNSVEITDDDNESMKNDDIQDWGSLKSILEQNLDLTPGDDLHQSWATFSPHGEKLLVETDPNDSSIDRFGDLGMFLVFQGGQWIWPGVRKGYERTIQLEDSSNDKNNTITLETLSLFPLVLSVRGFLSTNECDYIQRRAEPEMKYSVVTLMDHDKDRKDSDFRTSQTTFLSSNESPILKKIDDRTASLVRMPKQHQEHVQVLRYGHTQNYVTHHDYFHPKLYSQDPNTLKLIQNGKRNRMATVFWYLSDVDEGGHTVFPRFDKGPEPPTSSSWELGLKVKPEKGKVIVFYSMTPDGELDPYSLHGAAPVGEGHVKWAANKWVWNMPMGFTR